MIPLVDLRAPGFADEIDRACRTAGFFLAVGHGLDDVLRPALDAGRAFFAQPQRAKDRVGSGDRFGYTPRREGGSTEYLDLEVGGPPLSGLPTAVHEAARRYEEQALTVADKILEALAGCLGLEPTFFADRMAAADNKLRHLHYWPGGTTEPHTDYGTITLLATDGVAGLQIKPRGGSWTAIEAPADALVVNLGDLLARWTNDRYASTPHRVIASPDEHRHSMPLFVNVDADTVVECLPSCITDEAPAGYEPIAAGAFLRGRINKTIGEQPSALGS